MRAVRVPYQNTRDVVDELGRTKLHYAANNGAYETVKKLLDEGIDIDAQDNIGWTALHFAAQNNHFKTIDCLLEYKANPNLHDKKGNNPLWTAVMNAKGNNKGVVALLKSHTDINHKNNHGRSPLYMAKTLGYEMEKAFAPYIHKAS